MSLFASTFVGASGDPFTVIPGVGGRESTTRGAESRGGTVPEAPALPFASLLADEITDGFADVDAAELGLPSDATDVEGEDALASLILGALNTRVLGAPTEGATETAGIAAEVEGAAPTDGGSDTDTVTPFTTAALPPDPDRLHPELRARLERVMERMRAEYGHEVKIAEGYRTQERQAQLFAQGRTAPGPVVTWTRTSAHTDGLAVDVVIDGTYENPIAYERFARLAREEGLVSLAPLDPGHVELEGEPFDGRAFGSSVRVTQLGEIERPAPVARPARPADVARTASVAPVASVARPADVVGVARVAAVARPAVPGVQNVAPAAVPAAPTGGAVRTAEASPVATPLVGDPAMRSTATATATAARPDTPASATDGGEPTLPSASRTASGAAPAAPTGGTAEPAAGALQVAEHSVRTKPTEESDASAQPRTGEPSAPRGTQAAPIAPQGSEPAAPLFPRVEMPGAGVEAAERAERVRQVFAQAAQRPVQQMQLAVDSGTGDETLLNVRVQDGRVTTTIGVRDPFAAERIQSESAALRASLVRHGLETDGVNVRTLVSAGEVGEALRRDAVRSFVPGLAESAGRDANHPGTDSRSRGFWDSLYRDRNDSGRRGGQR
ncbi:MAG: D-alanyl-D-alanine carboxypeptidase family protein [Gemmatimonadetes bacterium]|nr:D-alanyl-D-alanine carboxypeptidase family protein [Gemmatimonadota bacterium]